MFILVGCSNRSIPWKITLNFYTEEQLNKKLVGISRNAIIDSWGEPDNMCFGMYCDFYKLNSEEDCIGIYYDINSNVEEVKKFVSDNE